MADESVADVEASGIYQIRNLLNGKRYVGSAVCFRVRWNGHRMRLRRGDHHSRHLQASWNKYGEDSFSFEVIETCAPELLIEREQHHLDAGANYNVCLVAGSTLGRRHSEQTRRKIGDRKLGTKMPARDAEYRAKLSAIHAGREKPQHVMDALQRGRARQEFTQDRRRRIGEALRAAYANGIRSREKSEDHKMRIGQAFAKLSDAEVREIRRLNAEGVTGRELAKRFGSNPGTISEICNRKRYRWVG